MRYAEQKMSMVAYVSGHGLGHAAREVSVLRHLPTEIPLIVKTRSPEWFWRAEISRPFTLIAENFDVGCRQSDSLTVDIALTKAAWDQINAENQARIDSEKAWLQRIDARLILTDIASFPLTIARTLRIPSVCIANFTWADIYSEYPGFEAVVTQLKSEYAQATLLLEAGLSLPMPYFSERESVGLIARIGQSKDLKLGPKKIALIYAGDWGMPFPWEQLQYFSDWHFVTLTPPELFVPNLTVLSREAMPHEDFVASVDCVISKAGYGIVGECLAAGTPLIYGPREHFAEFAALDLALNDWNGGIKISAAAFRNAQWPLGQIPDRETVTKKSAPGAVLAAARLAELYFNFERE
jgi:hypothetical protein